MKEPHCPVCCTPVLGPTVQCGRCHVLYHKDCYDYLGHCAIYGCWRNPVPVRARRAQPRAPVSWTASDVGWGLLRSSFIWIAGALLPISFAWLPFALLLGAVGVIYMAEWCLRGVFSSESREPSGADESGGEPLIKTRMVASVFVLFHDAAVWAGILAVQLLLGVPLVLYGNRARVDEESRLRIGMDRGSPGGG